MPKSASLEYIFDAIYSAGMRRMPLPREKIYDLYWYFASERQQVFMRRLNNQPAPWTRDVILSQYKFCNVFRVTDRVSQYLLREIIIPNKDAATELCMRIVLFRLFSRPETWAAVSAYLGRLPFISDIENGALEQALAHAKAQTGGLYTNAFILCANNTFNKPTKYQNHVALLDMMFVRNALADKLLVSRSLSHLYEQLLQYPLIGPFMAYQIAIDLNYSSYFRFNENDFTMPGPGALRGIAKVFESTGDYSPAEVINWMVHRQSEEFVRLNLPFDGLFGRPLHAIDCQGLFCEVDKYARVAVPELKSARQRIKQIFRASSQPAPLVFPSKWHIRYNDDRAIHG